MDTITHIVLGASLGEALGGKKMGKRAMLWGALANNIPDLDVIPAHFQNIPDSLLTHRGFTHSILFAVMVAPLLAICFDRIYRKKAYGFTTWLLIFSSGLFIHILIDSFTNYGTGWFEPFSHYRVSFNNIFVLDPFFTIALLISFTALIILKRQSLLRKYFLFGGLAISLAYLLFTFFNKASINNTFTKSLQAKDIKYRSIMTTPTPLNNFLWYCIAEADTGFYIGYRSVFDEGSLMTLNFIPKNAYLLGDTKHDNRVKKLIRFSQNYYCVTKNDSAGVDFHDIRFGQIGGWHTAAASFVFSYQITESRTGFVYINQGRFAAVSGEEFSLLIKRIEGLK